MPGFGRMLRRGLTGQRRALINLAFIDANSPAGWMGLPQTLVDMIFEYLKTDRNTLLSCSLTCRALFCSARRVIHERLYVTGSKVFPSVNKSVEWCWIFKRRCFHILSLADDADLIQYTRHLIVEVGQVFTPRTLQPHIQTFQKYVWLTSLTLTHFDPTPFLPVFDRYLHHLSHSLRSLHLISSRGTPDVMMDFISRFRNLDDLEFNPVVIPPRRPQKRPTSLGPRRWFTPLGGTLRIVNTNSQRTNAFGPLLHLPGGLRFRSLEFACCAGISTAGIIQECSSTLESVIYTLHCHGTFLEFDLGACSNLRVFEARIETSSYTFEDLMSWLAGVLGTIKSPVFSNLILSLDHATFEPHIPRLSAATINILDRRVSRLSCRSGMRFIIKGNLPLLWRQLLVLYFPSSTRACAIRFDFADPGAASQCGRAK